jgi:hypothetical protein
MLRKIICYQTPIQHLAGSVCLVWKRRCDVSPAGRWSRSWQAWQRRLLGRSLVAAAERLHGQHKEGDAPCRRRPAAPCSLGRIIHGAPSTGGGRQPSIAPQVRAAANVVVDNAGSSRSGDVADSDKLGEVVAGSSSSGRPAPAQSILAIGERHGRAAHLSPPTAINMIWFILMTKYLVALVAISSSTRSNKHQSIDQTIKNSEIQIYYSKTIKFRTWELIILCWYCKHQLLHVVFERVIKLLFPTKCFRRLERVLFDSGHLAKTINAQLFYYMID